MGTVGIVGQGYVGLPLAMAACRAGWRVLGFEINNIKLQALEAGSSPVEDISEEVLRAALESGYYYPTSNEQLITECSIVIFCVPTPIDTLGRPDISHLKSAIGRFAPYMSVGTLVINESTSYVGTLRQLVRTVVEESSQLGAEAFEFASAPERIDPGNTSWRLENTPRLVSGLSSTAHQRAVDFYGSFTENVVPVSSPEVAELAKLLENTFRLVNIGLVNELSVYARDIGIDMREVVSAAATKPYGYMAFYPGPGIGGHCIPVDPYYLHHSLHSAGHNSGILETSLVINELRPKFVLESALKNLKSIQKLLLIGVAYKAGLSDHRESAAEKIAKEAFIGGIEIFWHDTLVQNWQVGKKWQGEAVDFAIYLVDQPGQTDILKDVNCPIMDCTGALVSRKGVIQL